MFASNNALDLWIEPKDISCYKKGNTGVDYVHRFESGITGPSVVICGLTHGNEFCGMSALTYLLEHNFRPKAGALTLIFANAEAYQRFDPNYPLSARFIDIDLNRVWSKEHLIDKSVSHELARAREIMPFIEGADIVLDIHSTSNNLPPMLIYRDDHTNRSFAKNLRAAHIHICLTEEVAKGLLINHSFSSGNNPEQVSIVVECGQHLAKASARTAITVTLTLLETCDMLEPRTTKAKENHTPDPFYYNATKVVIAQTEEFRFISEYVGFENFEKKGTLFAYDGDKPLLTPYDNCSLILPHKTVKKDTEAVTLASFHKPVNS